MPTHSTLTTAAALSAAMVGAFALVQSCSTPPEQKAVAELEPGGGGKPTDGGKGTGGSKGTESGKGADAAATDRRRAVEDELRTIAKEYSTYRRVSAELHWSPEMCRAPVAPTTLLTSAPDSSPHGQKLYFLYARNAGAYGTMSAHGREERESGREVPPFVNPVRQSVVKEAFTPVSAEDEIVRYVDLKKQFQANPPGPGTKELERYAHDSKGGLVRTGDLAALFVMLKLEPGTPDTDNGWVYATIAPDLKTITSMGAIESCMNCHKQTDRDRLYGDKRSWPERWPGAPTAPPAPP